MASRITSTADRSLCMARAVAAALAICTAGTNRSKCRHQAPGCRHCRKSAVFFHGQPQSSWLPTGADICRFATLWPGQQLRASGLPLCSSSLASKRSKRFMASAVEPAKPVRISPSRMLRTLRAPCLTTVSPRVTWPSPPMATWSFFRTQQIVVPPHSNFTHGAPHSNSIQSAAILTLKVS